ncbi:MAG: AmmeMemoRadiSam system protein B, partial [Acidobacteriota bacterium]
MKLLVFALAVPLAAAAAASERPPAVAGAFYSGDPVVLRSQVEEMLAAAQTAGGARAVVVPHAGYPYSGPVAAEAFAALDGKSVRRVILLGPSHHQGFRGAALPARGVSSFATPLGSVALDTDAVDALRRSEEFRGPTEAHGPEHSLEVELPFLQVVAPEARIVPVLVGNQTDFEDAGRIARALAPLLDATTVVVTSSDFSHHGARYGWTPFAEPDLGGKLLRLGTATAERLAAIDPKGVWYQVETSSDTVCGARPLAV